MPRFPVALVFAVALGAAVACGSPTDGAAPLDARWVHRVSADTAFELGLRQRGDEVEGTISAVLDLGVETVTYSNPLTGTFTAPQLTLRFAMPQPALSYPTGTFTGRLASRDTIAGSYLTSAMTAPLALTFVRRR